MKKPLIYLLSATLVLSLASEANTANAVGTDSSNASIYFSAPEDPVDPVNPRDPSEPYPGGNEAAEDDGNVTGQAGPLSLDYISDIVFEGGDLSTGAETYQAVTASPFVQVSDRRGEGSGWELTAEALNFRETTIDEDGNVEYGESTLPGATITSSNGVATTDEEVTTTAGPTVNPAIELSTNGGVVNVATAEARAEDEPISAAQGLGTWVISWLTDDAENENVTLTVPEAAASEGDHTAFIEWTLSNGPGDETTDGETGEESGE